MNKNDLLGTFEQMVLAALIHLGAKAYGHSILNEIKHRTGRAPAIGAVSTTLNRLEKKGLVSSKLGEPTQERGGRSKRYFKIKAPGIKALSDSRVTMAKMFDGF